MDNKMKIGEDIANAKSAFYSKLKWGFTVFTILLSATEIALTIYSLYEYYNVDHLQIPHHMVDMKYSETEEASYVAYKSVTDQDGNYGDLNGNNARQWLALYYTKDKKAGAPLLAPTENGHEMVIKVGSTEVPGTGYAPLHMFGTPKTAQNLTFADGDSGYCYNDKKGGTYLYFSHANTVWRRFLSFHCYLYGFMCRLIASGHLRAQENLICSLLKPLRQRYISGLRNTYSGLLRFFCSLEPELTFLRGSLDFK
jgi:hypothetical protein